MNKSLSHKQLDYLHTYQSLLKLSPPFFGFFQPIFISSLKPSKPPLFSQLIKKEKSPIVMMNPMKGSSKKLSEMVTKWRRIRGHFVVYSKDNSRFIVPLCYLNHPIFRVLLEMSEEEYGLTYHGPLRVPCEKEFVEFILCLLRRNGDEEVEKAVFSCGKAAVRGREKGGMQRCVLS